MNRLSELYELAKQTNSIVLLETCRILEIIIKSVNKIEQAERNGHTYESAHMIAEESENVLVLCDELRQLLDR